MTNCKVLLTGCFSVGKTSLFNQFLYQKFDDEYHTSIGVKVDKKVVTTEDGEVSIMLWDLAGEMTQNKVPKAYFLGALYALYVIDLSLPFTWQHLEKDLAYIREIAPDVKIKVIGNKKDLLSPEELKETMSRIPVSLSITTSAKTGENIDNLFKQIANEIFHPTTIYS